MNRVTTEEVTGNNCDVVGITANEAPSVNIGENEVTHDRRIF